MPYCRASEESESPRQSPRSKISCPPYSCPYLPCPPPFLPCPPCTLPIIAENVSKFAVNPCDPNARARPNEDEDNHLCCNVCVPTCVPCPPKSRKKRKRKCKYIQPERPYSFAPQRIYLPPEMKMADDTIYRRSYIPMETEKLRQVIPSNNLCVGEGKMTEDTINRLSYKPYTMIRRCPIYPCEHKLLGEGPMQNITTNKHDYVPKPFVKPTATKAFTNLYTSNCPLSNKTVNRMSYMPVDLRKAKVIPFRPINAIEMPTGRMSDQTVNKSSYQPWEPLRCAKKPWAAKQQYHPPKIRMECNTVNKLSYKPPGRYVECTSDDPDCISCPESLCDISSPRCPGSMECSMPCCCPRASC